MHPIQECGAKTTSAPCGRSGSSCDLRAGSVCLSQSTNHTPFYSSLLPSGGSQWSTLGGSGVSCSSIEGMCTCSTQVVLNWWSLRTQIVSPKSWRWKPNSFHITYLFLKKIKQNNASPLSIVSSQYISDGFVLVFFQTPTRSVCCSSATAQSPAPSCPPGTCCSRWRRFPPSASWRWTAWPPPPPMCHLPGSCGQKMREVKLSERSWHGGTSL